MNTIKKVPASNTKCREAVGAIFTVFGRTQLGIKPATYYLPLDQNH